MRTTQPTQEKTFRALRLQEEERQQVLLDIHDGVAQTLTALLHTLQTLEHTAGSLSDKERSLLAKSTALAHRAIQETREVLQAIPPAALASQGLIPVVQQLVQAMAAQSGWQVEQDVEPVSVPEELVQPLYRVIREALTNIHRHAKTAWVRLALRKEAGWLVVEIQDRGIGFTEARSAAGTSGSGLFGMRERIELLDGLLRVESAPGHGTVVHVEVPLSQE